MTKKEFLELLRTITYNISRDHPYLQAAAFALRFVPSTSVPTAGVDKNWRCYVNPDFFISLKTPEQEGVIIHEIMHLVREHHKFFEENHEKDNIAKDFEINDDLQNIGIKLPDGALYPSEYNLPNFMSHPYYYENLPDDKQKKIKLIGVFGKQGKDSGQGGNGKKGDNNGENNRQNNGQNNGQNNKEGLNEGSGVTGVKASWELEPDDKETPGLSQEEADSLSDAVRKACKTYGSEAGGLVRDFVPVILKKKYDWAKYFKATLVSLKGPEFEYTYQKIRKKANVDPKIILPGKRTLGKSKIAILVDTSGSMSNSDLGLAKAVIRQIKEVGFLPIVYSGDTELHKGENLVGGGGTDMMELINTIPEKNVVCITDGYFDWNKEIKHKTIVFCIVEDGKISKIFKNGGKK